METPYGASPGPLHKGGPSAMALPRIPGGIGMRVAAGGTADMLGNAERGLHFDLACRGQLLESKPEVASQLWRLLQH